MKYLIISLLLIVPESNNNTLNKAPDKEKILELVNSYRQNGCNCGSDYFPAVAPVIWNDTLESAAQIHSEDMDNNDFFAHRGSNRSNAGQRLLDLGYDWMFYGENIGKGYNSEKDVVAAWIRSKIHCKNIMNPNFKEIGVASSGIYWTMVFARKKDWR